MSSGRSLGGDSAATDAPTTADFCPRCRRCWDDHTLRELREHHATRDIKLPFADSGHEVEMPGIPGQLVSSVVARAAVIRLPGSGPVPTLCLKFLQPDGVTMATEVTLPLPEKEMQDLAKLMIATIDAATRAARTERDRA